MSLQIVEKSGEALSKVYGVRVPAEDLNQKLDAKIAEMAPKLNIKGFRPGKVPPGHVRRLYGKGLMGEVVQETVEQSIQEAMQKEKLRPAGEPGFKMESDETRLLEGKEDLAYELTVDLLPEFELAALEEIKLKRPVYEPDDASIDEALAEIAGQNRTYETRTGKALKARDGDMVVADFVGRVDGETFEGGTASDAQIVLGSSQFIPGFEEQLKGAKPDSTVMVNVTFPDDYPAEELKGKAAEFEVTVKELRAPVEAAVDDEFAKKLGLDSLQALKDAVRGQLKGRYEAMSRFKLKRALLDELDSRHDFPLPPRMVDAEFDNIWRQVEAENQRTGPSEEDQGKSEDDLRAEYRKIAERRVRLGLVLAEIGQRHNVQLTEQEVTQGLQQEAVNMARQYNMQPQQAWELLRNNPQAQAQIRAPLYEDKVVDHIFAHTDVTDEPVSKEELLRDDELPEGYGG
ncbi:MAG TPA: trigger factor [Caulobacteraceae bacterium]|jgi:trigger factor